MGLDVAKHEVGFHFQKTVDRSKTIEKLSTQINQMQVIAKTLGEMKGAMMKVGQLISLYDVPGLPEEVREILSMLQNQAPALPFEDMKEVILSDIPDFFDRAELESTTPIAAASIGQVYKGRDQQGNVVAIKVQIPNIESIIRSDLKNLNVLAKLFSPWMSQTEMKMILAEIKIHLIQECDYQLEARNLQWFAATYANDPLFVFPKAFPELSSKHVLTMSFLDGMPLQRFLKKEPSQSKCNDLVTKIAAFYINQIFEHGLVHADPQFGNYVFTEHHVGVLDFGCVKRFSKNFVRNLTAFVHACIHRDHDQLHKGYLALGLTTRRDPKHLTQLLDEFVDIAAETYQKQRYQYGEYTVLNKVLLNLPKVFRQKKLHLPPDFVLLERTVAGLYFLAEKFKANIPVRKLISKYVFSDTPPSYSVD